eukprot:scaffold155846_cov33-Tisochrysis_lutea.AAC.4
MCSSRTAHFGPSSVKRTLSIYLGSMGVSVRASYVGWALPGRGALRRRAAVAARGAAYLLRYDAWAAAPSLQFQLQAWINTKGKRDNIDIATGRRRLGARRARLASLAGRGLGARRARLASLARWFLNIWPYYMGLGAGRGPGTGLMTKSNCLASRPASFWQFGLSEKAL